MTQKRKAPAGTEAKSCGYAYVGEHCKDTHSERPIQQVRALFLTGMKFTAKEINQSVGFNDARKVISELRANGWNIQDYRNPDQTKTYWLVSDQRQQAINWDGGAK